MVISENRKMTSEQKPDIIAIRRAAEKPRAVKTQKNINLILGQFQVIVKESRLSLINQRQNGQKLMSLIMT